MSYDEYDDYSEEEEDLDAMLVMGMLDEEDSGIYKRGGGCLTATLLLLMIPTLLILTAYCFLK